jgi:hypothetical protein
MGYESSAQRTNIASLVGATNRPENIVVCYVSFVPLTRLFVFEFESSRRFQLSFTDFSLGFAPPSRKYLQGHNPRENLPILLLRIHSFILIYLLFI